MSVPFSSSYVNFMTIVMILSAVYGQNIEWGRFWAIAFGRASGKNEPG
jgi:hypothetical protein